MAGFSDDTESDAILVTSPMPQLASLWVHDDGFSKDDVLVDENLFVGESLKPGVLLEIVALSVTSDVRDFQKQNNDHTRRGQPTGDSSAENTFADRFEVDRRTRCLCTATLAPADLKAKHPSLQISVTSSIAVNFGLRNRSQVQVSLADLGKHTASHVELGFRDAYVARSDMWRLASAELVGKTVYSGQKIQFLGTVRAVVKNIYVRGRSVTTAFFDGTTVPIFRSEAARFVLFIQMSREMWDFDSEGNGEILFNRVINGFLPDLFQRWSELEVKHLVTIVMFGRLEYSHHDVDGLVRSAGNGLGSTVSSGSPIFPHKDFYRVVIADMASAQWTTILDELKKDFRVFLRDISLQPMSTAGIYNVDEAPVPNPRITGRPCPALKGNILEAINIAASQFANDHVDRDLVRTGISIVIVTAGTGVYEVDRDLLNLTSENLTNNGVGIDVVCLSKMPLHSAPLFKYRPLEGQEEKVPSGMLSAAESPQMIRHPLGYLHSRDLGPSSLPSSLMGSTPRSLSRYASSFASNNFQSWCFGIPQWIDLSYWAPGSEMESTAAQWQRRLHEGSNAHKRTKRFVPRVRMYELQMIGSEFGLTEIAIPYMIETQRKTAGYRRMNKNKELSGRESVARSLSGSPNLLHKRQSDLSNGAPQTTGLLSSITKQQGALFNSMNEYDHSLFSGDAQYALGQKSTADASRGSRRADTGSKLTKDLEKHRTSTTAAASSGKIASSDIVNGKVKDADELTKKPTQIRGPQNARISRTISLAFKGFALPARAVASTEVRSEHVQAQPLQKGQIGAQRTLTGSSETLRSSQHTDSRPQSVTDPGVDEIDFSSISSKLTSGITSKPISINTPRQKLPNVDNASIKRRQPGSTKSSQRGHIENEKDIGVSSSESDDDDDDDDDDEVSAYTSVPKTTLPFIRNVNASNPIKRDPNAASWYGRWQHLYPRKPKAATVKWRSLCTPASVPLTTEEFPLLEQLESDYNSITYSVVQDTTNELLEHPQTRESLLQEMISIRLAHGYQLVVRSDLAASTGARLCSPSSFFSPMKMAHNSDTIYFYMGNTIQKLSYTDESHVQVTRFVRKVNANLNLPRSISYGPYIRTILSEKYATRTMSMTGFREEYPWELADGYLAGTKKEINNEVQQLRFWRARFVLIPVEPPASAYKLAPWMNDENDEEIHLRGISALTQVWQRNRYLLPEERKFKPSIGRKRDANPLEIIFRTMNPSEVVATELDIAMEEPGDVQMTQLLPESELMERETSNLAKVAHAMQGEKGIEIKNRRWHLRLHYNCFRGEEFINWILQNFKDVGSREEAVQFGNELMEHGLFQHVNGKHTFKDGHFFYSVEPEYRAQKTDPRQSWFPTSRRSDRSIPPTPISEHVARDSPLTVRSRSSSSAATESNEKKGPNVARTSNEKKRVSVSLSKMIRLDVDHRKRSNRLEVVNLHYDRVHNPENCYHIELSWLNVTSKLVEDAVLSWAIQSEKYGLKLVELPIAEASNISNNEPFRSPYPISLVIPPLPKPSNSNNTYFSATSFGPHLPQSSSADDHIYQKAILKRFNFVLDLEAASEFPEDVEILYSWGKLEYRYTQFVHRSGVILAQITSDGSFLLLANRLYNTRYAAAKDTNSKLAADAAKKATEHSRLSTHHHQPTPQSSGLLALNPPNTYSSPTPSPHVRASADVLGTRAALASSTMHTHTTPEAIKDDLESFCRSAARLEAFYKEVSASLALPSASAAQQRSSSTSSSVLRAFRPGLGSGMVLDNSIPDIRLPERLVGGGGWQGGRKVGPSVQVQTQTQTQVSEATGYGVGSGSGLEDRARESPKRKKNVIETTGYSYYD